MIDWVVLAWFVASALGAVIAGIGVREGLAEVRALGQAGNGRRTVAWDYLRTQAGRFLICLIWLLMSLPLLADDHQVELTIYTAALIFSNAALALFAFLSLRDRRSLLH